jgi:hypothetical protein
MQEEIGAVSVDGDKYVIDLLWIGVPFADAANADPLFEEVIRLDSLRFKYRATFRELANTGGTLAA